MHSPLRDTTPNGWEIVADADVGTTFWPADASNPVVDRTGFQDLVPLLASPRRPPGTVRPRMARRERMAATDAALETGLRGRP